MYRVIDQSEIDDFITILKDAWREPNDYELSEIDDTIHRDVQIVHVIGRAVVTNKKKAS